MKKCPGPTCAESNFVLEIEGAGFRDFMLDGVIRGSATCGGGFVELVFGE